MGYSIPPIHSFIDESVKWLGAGHRIFRHGYPIVKSMREIYGEKGAKVALLHILIDGRVLDRDWIEKEISRGETLET